MSVDILGTNCSLCLSMVKCCFTSTETVRLLRTESPGRPPHIVPELSSLHNYALSMFHKTGCRHSRVTVSTAWTSFLVSSPPPPFTTRPHPPTAHLPPTSLTPTRQRTTRNVCPCVTRMSSSFLRVCTAHCPTFRSRPRPKAATSSWHFFSFFLSFCNKEVRRGSGGGEEEVVSGRCHTQLRVCPREKDRGQRLHTMPSSQPCSPCR